jgi:hypothetical protein
MQTVTVRGAWLPGHVAQVAVWERDPRHPGGELYLTSGQVATVCLTPGVNAALARGSLELVEELVDGNPPPLIVEEPVKVPVPETSASSVESIAQAEPAAKVTKRK